MFRLFDKGYVYFFLFLYVHTSYMLLFVVQHDRFVVPAVPNVPSQSGRTLTLLVDTPTLDATPRGSRQAEPSLRRDSPSANQAWLHVFVSSDMHASARHF